MSILSLSQVSAAEISLGGSLGGHLLPMWGLEDDSCSYQADLHMFFQLYEDTYDMELDLHGLYQPAGFDLDIDKAVFNVYPGDRCLLSGGYDILDYGFSRFLSPVNWFSSMDLQSLFDGDLAGAMTPELHLKGTWYTDDMVLECIFTPYASISEGLDPDSRYFPLDLLDDSLQASSIGSVSYQYGNRSFTDGLGIALSLGGMSMRTDWIVQFYYGADHDPTVAVSSDVFTSAEDISVILIPNYDTVYGVSAGLRRSFDRLLLYADASVTASKSLLRPFVSIHGDAQEGTFSLKQYVSTASVLESSVGIQLELPMLETTIIGEYHRSDLIFSEVGVALPSFSHLGILSSYTAPRSCLGSLSQILVLSAEDVSGAYIPSVTFEPSQEFALTVLAPVFFGSSETDFGLYRSLHQIMISAELRF